MPRGALRRNSEQTHAGTLPRLFAAAGENQVTHQPNIDSIPASLRSLAWKPMDQSRTWWDGQTLLVALPICDDKDTSKWWYEFHVVTIKCDEDYLNVELAGDPWGWELNDVDYYIEIRK